MFKTFKKSEFPRFKITDKGEIYLAQQEVNGYSIGISLEDGSEKIFPIDTTKNIDEILTISHI